MLKPFCPKCRDQVPAIKRGFFTRSSDKKRIQRFICQVCRAGFSSQSGRIDYRHRKRSINQQVFHSLCSGVSQRRLAFLCGVKPAAIARRVVRFGEVCAANLEEYRQTRPKATVVLFDEMESFEHTKCKPLTMPIAVEEESRKILSVGVGPIAAKGPLASISRRKYGTRVNARPSLLQQMMAELRSCVVEFAVFKSDESQHYPRPLSKTFPEAQHIRYKGRRPAAIGQGELKQGGNDPLFVLNHTYAMIRDNLKRLTRRTWCTTKNPERLKDLLNIYAHFHNMWVDGDRRLVLRRAISN